MPQPLFKVLDDILGDILKMLSKNNVDERKSKIFASIKNTMSDRCFVQKKFNNLFKHYRADVVPAVIEDWCSLSPEEQQKILQVNCFFSVASIT